MTINVSCGSFEATGFAEIKDVNITFEFGIEETTAVTKQILPIFRELKEFGIFQTQKDNDKLCEDLNKAKEERRDIERERDHAKAKEDFLIKKSNEMEEEIRELKEQLKEANLKAKLK